MHAKKGCEVRESLAEGCRGRSILKSEGGDRGSAITRLCAGYSIHPLLRRGSFGPLLQAGVRCMLASLGTQRIALLHNTLLVAPHPPHRATPLALRKASAARQ